LDEERTETSSPKDDHTSNHHLSNTEHLDGVPHLRPQTLRDPAAGQTKRLGVVPHQPKVGVKGGEDGGRDESDGSGEIVELLRLERDGNGRECRLDEVAAWLTRQC